MAGKAGVDVRRVDVKALQKHLVEIGDLPDSVLTDKDSFPPSKEQVATAVASLASDYAGRRW
jgi:hypothetical protein